MKNKILKALVGLGCLTFGVFMAPQRSYAVTSPDSITAENDQTYNSAIVYGYGTNTLPTAIGVTNSTTSSAMVLTYTGTAADAEVVISTGASTGFILFYAPAATKDTSIGNLVWGGSGFDLAGSTWTLGVLCDAINKSNAGASNYHCQLTGGIRSDVASTILEPVGSAVAGVNNLNGVGGYNIPIGTATMISLGITPAAGRRVILNECEVSSTGTLVQVFGEKRGYGNGTDLFGNVLNDASVSWTENLTQNTLTHLPIGSGTSVQPIMSPWLEFKSNPGTFVMPGTGVGGAVLAAYGQGGPPSGNQYNGKVVVRVTNFVSVGVGLANQQTANFVECMWSEK